MSNDLEKQRVSGESPREAAESLLPTTSAATESEKPQQQAHQGGKGTSLPAAFYVTVWIAMSSSVILFNKWILDYADFPYPIFLTTWHLLFGTIMTQIMARTTTLLDGRKNIKMTGRVYLRAICPIGFFFSLSLICGNITYLYLSVAFIQMLKATMPVATLLAMWGMRLKEPNLKEFFNVSFIVIGVIIASYGEVKFVLTGFLFQMAGVAFEAIRLTMVQRLLSSAEFKMDPLVSFYYFAPVCAVMNGMVAMFLEVPKLSLDDVARVGYFTLLANAGVAFLLNVAVVFLIGKTSSLVMTLCGVLKDILLVAVSIMLWGTPVTPLQFFGYSIALGGMVYYKLGAEAIKGHLADAGRRWAEFGQRSPAQRKIMTIFLALLLIFILAGGLAPAAGYDTATIAAKGNDIYASLGAKVAGMRTAPGTHTP